MNVTPQTAPALTQCKCCKAAVHPKHNNCPFCNFPLKGTTEEQNLFIYHVGLKQLKQEELRHKAGRGITAFYVSAFVYVVWGVIGFFRSPAVDDAVFILVAYAAIALIFVLFGIWSKKQPKPAIITGLAVYLALNLLVVIADPGNIMKGLLVKIIIIGGLVRAYISAQQAEKAGMEQEN